MVVPLLQLLLEIFATLPRSHTFPPNSLLCKEGHDRGPVTCTVPFQAFLEILCAAEIVLCLASRVIRVAYWPVEVDQVYRHSPTTTNTKSDMAGMSSCHLL